MAKVSVVVCVYNTEISLFERCLNSIFNSTLKDLEVIIVNDGSTSNYESLKEKFSDCKWIDSENNGTLSARILGVKNATSPYVCFVDSDDEISFGYLEAMQYKLKQTDGDVVINDWAFLTERTRYVCGNDSLLNSDFVVYNDECLAKFFEKSGYEHSYFVIWNKMFKREILIEACKKIEKLCLPKITFSEDVIINYFVFYYAKVVANLHFGYYFYRVHPAQQVYYTGSDKLKEHISEMSLTLKIIEDNLKENNKHSKFSDNLNSWKKVYASSVYEISKSNGLKELTSFIKQAFGQTKLSKLSRLAHKAYANHKLLPLNILEVDEVLKQIKTRNLPTSVFAKKSSYARKEIVKMQKLFNLSIKFTKKRFSDVILPEEKYSIKLKIIHNNFFYRVGIILFPKGSKIRRILKSKF